MTIPVDPPIFHITHVDNLPSIVREGGLWCDAQRSARRIGHTNIGHEHIKQRRLTRAVTAGAGGKWTDVKEERQAEFLVHEFFPWTAVTAVAVMTPQAATRAQLALRGAAYQPPVTTRPAWYY